MKKYLTGFYYSLPIQLFLLHFRRYQVFLIFWYILFATVNAQFMKSFGAYALYLAPEYLGTVNSLSTAIVGFSIGIFIMSWNITTFILHSKNVKFLATTAQPFLKYCINNAIIPLIFTVFYFVKAVQYDRYKELIEPMDILFLVSGSLGGFILAILISFLYFFGADKTIYKRMAATITSANKSYIEAEKNNPLPNEKKEMRIDWFLSAKFQLRKPRDVRHYSQDFLDVIFKRHHFAAVIAVFVAFFFLIGVGFLSDNKIFQVPAAASITIFFAILIAVAGAFSVFLHSWSIPTVIVLYLLVNYLYQNDIIDLRNKAYGLDYVHKEERPAYDRESIEALASPENIEADKQAFLVRLNKWKERQGKEKPVMFIVNVSGGGIRSATFTMNVLQHIDSITQGKFMSQTVLVSGASGGMLGAAYFRELYLAKQKNNSISLQDKRFVDDISKDLLNPLFSSFISRDLAGPAKKFTEGNFTYVKDRGYAFEQKLNENTHGVFDKTISAYTAVEDSALSPTLFFNATITRDGRKMIIGSRPARFLMRATPASGVQMQTSPDALDFNSFFALQRSADLRVSSALRINATFPYALPNVWLPSSPVIDIMDAGLRDNYGQETGLRFIETFRDWIKANTSRVVLIQIRDTQLGDWDRASESNDIISFLTKPFLLLQNNWYKLQDYYQGDQLQYMADSYGPDFQRLCFQYVPEKKDAYASLSFHLNALEKRDIAQAINNATNQRQFDTLAAIVHPKVAHLKPGK
ncbi:MAG: hypothetical protein J0I41_05220 [Filimonas sp.]|nr:hypothetical protein [Filimonas sp.]